VRLHSFFNLGARPFGGWGGGGQCHVPASLTTKQTRTGTHYTEAGWHPGPVWITAMENTKSVVPTGIGTPHRTARVESLNRSRYAGPVVD